MEAEQFVELINQSIFRENTTFYKRKLEELDINKVKDPYWSKVLYLYQNLNSEQKDTLVRLIEQVQIDTISTLLGVLDETVFITEETFDVNVTVNNTKVNGDLQDMFLATDEDNR